MSAPKRRAPKGKPAAWRKAKPVPNFEAVPGFRGPLRNLVSFVAVPDKATCLEMMEEIFWEVIETPEKIKASPAPELSRRYTSVFFWLTHQTAMTAGDIARLPEDPAVAVCIGRLAFQAIGSPQLGLLRPI